LEVLCSEFVLHPKRIENGNFGFRVSSAWDALFIPLLKSLFFVLEQCSFVEHRNYKIIYRRYASLFFLVGVDGEEVITLTPFPFLRLPRTFPFSHSSEYY